MNIAKLNVKSREATGRGSSRRLRQAGAIPAVVYSRSGSFPLQVAQKEFIKLWKSLGGAAALVEIVDETGKNRLTLIRDAQRDPIHDHFLHVDFNEVVEDQEMTASVRVHVLGEPNGVKNFGGILQAPVHELRVRCLPRNLPRYLEVDVTHMNVGDSLHVRELKLQEGLKVVDDPSVVVAAVVAPAKEEEAAPVATVTPDAVPTARDLKAAEVAKETKEEKK